MQTQDVIEHVNLVSLDEVAMRIQRTKKTIQNWISTGKVRGAQGLCEVAGRIMIDWPRFEAAMIKRCP